MAILKHIRRNLLLMSGIVVLLLHISAVNAFTARIKDIAQFEGVRENQLVGYGLVVGLDGTGDKSTATLQTISNMLQRMGVTVNTGDLKAKNAASVVVTATLPPFPKPGMKIDAVVSTMADAKSLQGGTLILTPLKGADGKVYAVGQGPLSIGGFTGGTGQATIQQNHPTVARVPQGVIIERDPGFTIGQGSEIKIFLHRPDFTTATDLARIINNNFSGNIASALDPSAVLVHVPAEYENNTMELMTMIERMNVTVDAPARVVINERTGTVVIDKNVKLSPIAIAHGNLTIEIKSRPVISQPPPFAPESAETVVVPDDQVIIREGNASLVEVSGTSLNDIVKALNSLGVTPRDLVAILQTLKAAGALRAELEII